MINNENFILNSRMNKLHQKCKTCQHCAITDCEILREYLLIKKKFDGSDIPLYITQSWENCEIQKLVQVECNAKKVSAGVGEHYKINEDDFDKWSSEQYVFISAQTGCGKNYFIENIMIPYLRELNYRKKTNNKILIISNRIALRLQIESRINRIKRNFEQGTISVLNSVADVISYQSFLNRADYLKKIQEKKTSNYKFVICDEAHFFTSDASFNPETERILSSIVNIFRDSIRVYMTATPYQCLKYINKHEEGLGVIYHFKRNYDYLNIKYFSVHKELIDEIVDSVTNENQKWIIFIDNIKKCEAFKKELEKEPDMLEKVFTADASSKSDKVYQKMILNESLDSNIKVLVTTSVIDNGVNFRNVHNIVVSDINKVKCLQMVGRIRVSSGDKVTLYLKRFNDNEIKNKIEFLEQQRDAYHAYDLAYDIPMDYCVPERNNNSEWEFINTYYGNELSDFENAKHWFLRSKDKPKKLYINNIARSEADKSALLYKSILEEMHRNAGANELDGQRYLEYQLSWFGKVYDLDNDISVVDKDKAKKELLEFIETYANSGAKLYKKDENENDEQEKFSKEFTKLYDNVYPRQDPNRNRIYSISKINKLLESQGLGYKVESDRTTEDAKNKKSFWTVNRCTWIPVK